jgi:aspartate carbamoyltransferase catalytic subunit
VDLLSIDSLTDDQIAAILGRGDHWFTENRAGRSSQALAGKIVFNLFYENSTRTAMSFATATARLGATPISLSVEHSSVKKGETLEDTARPRRRRSSMRRSSTPATAPMSIRLRHCSMPRRSATTSGASKG